MEKSFLIKLPFETGQLLGLSRCDAMRKRNKKIGWPWLNVIKSASLVTR